MQGGTIPNIGFQTFYLSKDETNCPLLPEIVRIGKKYKDQGLIDDESPIIISLGYGKRVLINGNVEDYSKIVRNELIEIADFNPVKNVLLIIGQNEPRSETPVHWMIHHARDDVNVVIQINNLGLIEKIDDKFPTTEKDALPGSFEQIKEVLRLLRDNKILILRNQGVIFVGSTVKEIEDSILKICEDLK
jgi:ribulose-5-phosphate 4-epimerase/fuculose-1-phosphate aldolase